MVFGTLSLFAPAAASIANMVLGMLWYSPALFGTYWMKGVNINQKNIQMHAGHIVGALLLSFVTALGVNYINSILGAGDYSSAIHNAALIWIFFYATTLFSRVIWENTPVTVYLINAGHTLVYLIMASCLGVLLS